MGENPSPLGEDFSLSITVKCRKMKRILVACEESQAVTKEFRKLGFEAYSCDLLECSGGRPEWHIMEDIFKVIERENWDVMIGFPPCTRLTVAANRYYKPEYANRFPNIQQERKDAKDFFLRLVNANIEHIAIENPIGVMSTAYRKPDQIIQPYFFGEKERKATCLWLKNLPKLVSTNIVKPDIVYHKSGRTDGKLHFETLKLPKEERAKARSKTFQGIATAMAQQWSKVL